ncbi:MAG: hypothetical protein OEV94_02125 [Deltaproteobacteria bacterium]|nr:hypothetical protein [Deltaproteobacteria bacterium]
MTPRWKISVVLTALWAVLLGFPAAWSGGLAWAEDLPSLPPSPLSAFTPGVNAAGLVRYPTAFDQYTDNYLRFNVEIHDLALPDLRMSNVFFGHQFGSLQVTADANFRTVPEKAFDNLTARAKLRLVTLEPMMLSFGFGLVGRYADSPVSADRMAHRNFSLMFATTAEVIPFDEFGGLLVNFYLDNLVAVPGFRFQISNFIHLIGEGIIIHEKTLSNHNLAQTTYSSFTPTATTASLLPATTRFVGGLEIESDNNLDFQLLYDSESMSGQFQVGWGF